MADFSSTSDTVDFDHPVDVSEEANLTGVKEAMIDACGIEHEASGKKLRAITA